MGGFCACWRQRRDGTTISIGHQSGVMPATFQDQSPPAERAADDADAPVPPPKRLPHDPAYEDKPASERRRHPRAATAGGTGCRAAQGGAETRDGQTARHGPESRCRNRSSEIPVPLKSLPQHAAPPGEATSTDEGSALATDQYSCNSAAACEQCVPQSRLRCWLDGVAWEGWLDQGATINTLSPRDRINGPVTFNNRSNDYQLNQLYGRLKRDVDTESGCWGLGGRIDFLYGTDSIYTEARGLETFDDFSPKWNAQQLGAALPQCYMEAYCPWGNGLDMKLGHFYAPIGYESVPATEQLLLLPFVHLPVWRAVHLHRPAGGDQVGRFRHPGRHGPAAGTTGRTTTTTWGSSGASIGRAATSGRTSRLGVTAGREQPDPSTNIRTLYSLVIQQKIGDRWQYVFQHDFGNEPGAGVGGTIAQWYGINQYLFYTINDCWKAGMRFEWFYDGGGSRVRIGDVPVRQTGTYYELTAGVNWTPNKHVIVRPEFRWDFTGTPDLYPFGDDTRSNQVLVDCDVIVRF